MDWVLPYGIFPPNAKQRGEKASASSIPAALTQPGKVELCQPGNKTPPSHRGEGLQASVLGTGDGKQWYLSQAQALLIGPGKNKMSVSNSYKSL